MTILLDANVLIALVVADHVHHDAAEKWLEHIEGSFATCPITQGSLVRFLVRKGQPVDTATSMVAAVAANPRHDFWPDEVSYLDVSLRGVIGHRQVADAYLAGLARARSGRLATFDQGMSKLHRDIVELVPTRDV